MFIVFEGADSSGKTIQSKMLYEALRNKGSSCFLTTEPSKDTTGLAIRECLTHPSKFVDQDEENEFIGHLCLADRFHHVFNKVDGIASLLNENRVVISDRYHFSTMAYNYNINNTDKAYNLISQYMIKRFPVPDLIFYLKITPELSIDRLSKLTTLDKYENLAKQISVINAYDKMIENKIMPASIIDASKGINDIHNEILSIVLFRLACKI